MTKEELENNHLHVPDNHNHARKEHAKVSIQYAIRVLEELQDKIGSLSPTAWQVIKDKKEELKSLIE